MLRACTFAIAAMLLLTSCESSISARRTTGGLLEGGADDDGSGSGNGSGNDTGTGGEGTSHSGDETEANVTHLDDDLSLLDFAADGVLNIADLAGPGQTVVITAPLHDRFQVEVGLAATSEACASATFSKTISLTSLAALADGTYVLCYRLSLPDGTLSGVLASQQRLSLDRTAPAVTFAQPTVNTNAPIALVAVLAGNEEVTWEWSQASGTGTLTFTAVAANPLSATVAADADGRYEVRATAVNAAGNTGSAVVVVNWDATPPAVDAGSNRSIDAPTALAATVADQSATTCLWTHVSGPATLGITDATSCSAPTVSASDHGDYVARLTARDAFGNEASDEITIRWSPFVVTRSFDSAAEATFDANQITVTGGAAALRASRPGAVDESNDGFSLGQFAATEYSASALRLDAAGLVAKTGTFTSRIFDAGAVTPWSRLWWQTDRPYQRPLPDNGGTDVGFSAGAVNMTENRLLLHFDEPAGTAALTDSSGLELTGTCTAPTCPTFGGAGKIGGAAEFADSSLTIPHDDRLNVGPNASWSLWFLVEDGPETEPEGCFFEKGFQDDNDSYALLYWNGNFALEFTASDDSSDFIIGDAYGEWNRGAWHHLAVVFDDDANQVRFYLNGVVTDTVATAKSLKTGLDMTHPLVLGRQNHSYALPFRGKIDELAIFNRALGAAEIKAMYDRGAMQVRLQARACADATCSTNPAFVGPGNSPAAHFASDGLLGNRSFVDVSGLTDARYGQYRIELVSADTTISPLVHSAGFRSYPTTPAKLVVPLHAYTTIDTLSMTMTGSSSDVRAQLSPNGTDWYQWTGATWGSAADDWAEANDLVTLTSNATSFPSAVSAGTLHVRFYLQSPGGLTPVAIDSVQLEGKAAL